jgi:hypothetical protein
LDGSVNERDVVRRLWAYCEGRPQPCGETKHLYLAPDRDVLIVAFVRMGGESRPWGIAFGRCGAEPKIITVPEARNRDLVAAMVAEFAPVLLSHLRTPGYCRSGPESRDDLLPLRQIWLPNSTHLEMLHHLAYAYAFTRSGGADRELLNAFGRACGWLFREAQRSGQQTVTVASAALKQSYTFPAEDTRQGHLGFLLAWLGTKGSRDARLQAALEAERQTVATSLDPDLERAHLQGAVEAWGASRRQADEAGKAKAARVVTKSLAPELSRRWKLTESAILLLRSDKRRMNHGVERLVAESASEQWYQHIRLELKLASPEDGPPFFPSVETDRNAAAAASRFFVHAASAEMAEWLLVQDDAELLADMIAAGDAIKGQIVAVRDDAPPHSGKGKGPTRPVWVVRDEADRQLRLRPGTTVCVVGAARRTARIRQITEAASGALDVEIEIENLKTRNANLPSPHDLAPNSADLVGCDVALIQTSYDGLSRRKSTRVWNKLGPGAWLTHAAPGGVLAQHADVDHDDVAAVREAERLG